MSVPSHCIKRPVMTTLLASAAVIFGFFAYRLLPVAALPRVDFPTIVVTAQLPGASPSIMGASVALPLEKQFATIDGLDNMNSINTIGTTQVTLQFNLNRNIDAAALDVQSAISIASRTLPSQMPAPPSFRKINPSEQAIVFLTMSSPTMQLSQIDEYAENIISPKLSTLPGVAQVQIFGQQKFAIRIQYNPDELAKRNLAVEDVVGAVIAADSNVPNGTISTDKQQVTIATNDQMIHASDYENIIVAWRNGNPVRLREVAKVVEGVQNTQVASYVNGAPNITLAIQRQPGANTVAVADSVTSLLPSFRAQMPPSVDMRVLNDRSVSIRQSVHDVTFTLAATIALVVMVIFMFLKNVTATLIPAVVLPVALVGTFGVMYLLNYSIDNLSLMALTLAVGFVVDDAIVMLENVVRHVEHGESVMQAALKGSGEIAFTIISMTTSLLAAFIPVLFMGGVVGRLFHEFAMVMGIAVVLSSIVSLTLTPMMCSRVLRSNSEGEAKEMSGPIFRRVLSGYEKGLDWCLEHRFSIFLLTMVTLAATIYIAAVVPKGFFPIEDTGLITGITESSEDSSFQAMQDRQKPMADIVSRDEDVDAVGSTVGAGGPNTVTSQGRLTVVLKDRPDPRKTDILGMIQRLRSEAAGVPGMNVFFQPVQNLTVGTRISKAAYQYTIQATNIDDLYKWTPDLTNRIKQLPGLQDVSSDLQIRAPVLKIDVDRDRAATLGVSLDEIRQTLYSGFGTRQISTIFTPANQYYVITEVAPEFQNNLNVMQNLYVRANGLGAASTNGGQTGSQTSVANTKVVPLQAVAKLSVVPGPTQVNHQGQLPAATISFNLQPGVALGQATAEIRQLEQQLTLPATIVTGFQGTAQVFQQSLDSQGLLIIGAVLVIYVVLGCLYESFVHPITILSGLPSAALGALLTLILFRLDLSVIAIIGVVMLIGIVKKNAIMMIDFAIKRRRQGYEAHAAIREACLLRFRPIMMTTMAALMGALPIAFGWGAGGELRQPLGLTVVGGLMVSQALTLFITPVIYTYLEGAATFLTRRSTVREPIPEVAE